jgi:hypothetical protein
MKSAEEPFSDRFRRFEGPGGTRGGLGSFVLGLILAAAGAYLILEQVNVTSDYWWWGRNTFGLTLVPLIIGIGLLFFNSRSMLGWALAGLGAAIIFAGILTSLQIYFRTTSLFNLLVMIFLFAGGLGLMARSLRSS